MKGLSMVGINHPEKLVPGKYNIVAVHRHLAVILWKDEEYFVVTNEKPKEVVPITETWAFSIVSHGLYVKPEPIPLNDISEWEEQANKVDIRPELPQYLRA